MPAKFFPHNPSCGETGLVDTKELTPVLHPAIVVRNKDTIQGNGLFTTQLIRKGTLIWKLDEPTYTWKEIKTWQEDRFKAFEQYGFQCGIDRYSLPEGPSREMNHSCDPSTWWTDSDSLIARRDIQAGEEVTYDYSSCDIDIGLDIECNCGTQCCRGNISNRDFLDSRWQEQYGSNLPPHVLNAIRMALR
ncbi:MAG: SET domain-containing protein, partial [Gammaproteobacteria bacterium]|nr:SET domain-containing protein [Gammaproteobacteria bacterium]